MSIPEGVYICHLQCMILCYSKFIMSYPIIIMFNITSFTFIIVFAIALITANGSLVIVVTITIIIYFAIYL